MCKNNERTIGSVLRSVRELAAEIVAVDSGSTDATLDLLDQAGARVVRTEWRGHVRTKQLALDLACQNRSIRWVLCLDSDEPVEDDLAESIRSLIAENDRDIAAAEVNRRVFVHGRYLRHAWQPEWRLRLARAGTVRWAGRDPHDRLELRAGVHGRIVRIPGTLRHESFQTFAEHLRAQLRHAEIAAESMLADGQHGSVRRLLTSPTGAFLKQMVGKQAWRDGLPGLLAAGTTAAGTLMKHLILLERSRLNGSPDPDPAPLEPHLHEPKPRAEEPAPPPSR